MQIRKEGELKYGHKRGEFVKVKREELIYMVFLYLWLLLTLINACMFLPHARAFDNEKGDFWRALTIMDNPC